MGEAPGGRPLFFYSAWPLGYHNLEAERKALALARVGWDVTYVTGVGFRDPRPTSLPKLVDRVQRKLRSGTAGEAIPSELRSGGVLVIPPRRVEPVRRLNVAWLERQLQAMIGPWDQTLAWLRWPTPELTAALRRLRPAVVVYEVVDAYYETPGAVGPWRGVVERADVATAALADLIVTPGEHLADRYRSMARPVRLVPHGVDLGAWRERPRPRPDERKKIGFIGTLDYRLDVPILRAVAQSHPEWRLRLIGPVQRGFDPAAVSDLDNVSVEPPVPAARVPDLNTGFDAGIMPYFDHPEFVAMTPVKNLELMAAGTPAVARPSPALEPYADLLYFASTPEEFVAQLERAIGEDSPERAHARRAVGELNGWDRRLEEICAIAAEAVAGP